MHRFAIYSLFSKEVTSEEPCNRCDKVIHCLTPLEQCGHSSSQRQQGAMEAVRKVNPRLIPVLRSRLNLRLVPALQRSVHHR
jgi:hypothetical protein